VNHSGTGLFSCAAITNDANAILCIRKDQRTCWRSPARPFEEYARIEYAELPVKYCILSILLCSNLFHQTNSCR
jgi:hypothetical protein